jgi:hypothetical protein
VLKTNKLELQLFDPPWGRILFDGFCLSARSGVSVKKPAICTVSTTFVG